MSKPGSPADNEAPATGKPPRSGEWPLYDAETDASVAPVGVDGKAAAAAGSLDDEPVTDVHREVTGQYDAVITREQHEPPTDIEEPFDLDDEVIDVESDDFSTDPDQQPPLSFERLPPTAPGGHRAVDTEKYPKVVDTEDEEATATGVDDPLLSRGPDLGYADTASVVRPTRGPESITMQLPHRPEAPAVESDHEPLDLEPTQARAAVLSNWSKAVAGLRVEAARAADNAIRARLLTVAAGLTWQLVGDPDDAEHLIDQALEADPSLVFAHRERALMRLREGRDQVEVMAELAAMIRPRDQYDQRRRLRGRFYLFGAVVALGRAAEGDSAATKQAEELLQQAREDLEGTSLLALWQAYQSWWEGRPDFAQSYLMAIRTCRLARLRAALLADLATGLWSGRYERGDEVSGLDPVALIREAVSLGPTTEPYDSLLRLLTARDPSAQHRELMARLEHGADEGMALRAAAVAEAAGEANQALGVLALVESAPSVAIDWRLLRLASRWGDPERARSAVARLRESAKGQLSAAMLALEEASLRAQQGDREGWDRCIKESYDLSPDLDTGRLELGRRFLMEGAYRELMDLRGYDLRAKSTGHTRRGEILESRLSSPVEAIAEYEAALRLDLSDMAAFRGLERLFAYTGDYDGMARLYADRSQTNDVAEHRADLLRLAAHVELFERVNPDGAMPLYETLSALRPHDAVVRSERIALAYRLGDVERACDLVDEVLLQVEADDEARLLAHDRLNQLSRPISVDRLLAYRERVGVSPILEERLEIAALMEGRLDDLLEGLGRNEAGTRDHELLLGHLLTRLGRATEAVAVLDRWVARYTEDVAAEVLMDDALLAAGEVDRLEDRWADGARTEVRTAQAGSRWDAWRAADFDLDGARSLLAGIDAAEDQRLIWAATLAACEDPEARSEAARELLAADPEDIALRALAEATAREALDHDALLRLYIDWVRGAQGTDREWLVHRLASCCLAVGRAADAAAMWRDLTGRQPELVLAATGLVQALREHGDEDAARAAERALRRGHAVGWQDRAGQRRRLESLFDGGSSVEARALVALALAELAEGAGDRGAARLWARRAAELIPHLRAARRMLIGVGGRPDDEPALPDALRSGVEVGFHLLHLNENPDRSVGVFLASAVGDSVPEAVAGLLVLGQRRQDAELAVEALRGWSRVGSDANLLVHVDLATARLAELHCGDREAALEACERAWTRRPENAWIAAHLARLVGGDGGPSPEQRERLGGLAGQGAPAGPALYHLAMALEARERADTLAFILSLDPHFLPAEWALLALPDLPLPDAALARRGRRRRCPGLLVTVARRALDVSDLMNAESLLYEALSFSSAEDIASFGGPYDGLIRVLRDRGRGIELIALGEDLVGRAATGAVRRRLLEAAVRVALMPGTSRAVARTALLQLVELAPGDRALLRRAIALTAQAGDWERVIALLKAEVPVLEELHPGIASLAWWEIGEIRRRSLDDLPGALEAYETARERGEDHFFVHSAIGRMLIEQGRWDELAEHTAQLLKTESQPDKIARVHVNLAGIEEFHRLDSRRALEHYLEALAEHPENRSAIVGTVRVAERAGQPAAAAVAMEALATFIPGEHGDALLLRSAEIAELQQGETGLALSIYQRLADKGQGEQVRFGLESCELAEGGVDALFKGRTAVSNVPSLRTLLTDQRRTDWDADENAPAAVWASRIFRDGGDYDGHRARLAAARLGDILGDASAAAGLVRLGLLVGALRGAPADMDLRRTLVLLDPSDELGLLKLEADAEPGSPEERWSIEARVRVAPHGLLRAEAMTALLRHLAVRGLDDQLWDALEQLATEAPELPLVSHYRSAMATNVDEPTQAAEQLEQEAKIASSKPRSAQLWLKAAKLRRRQLGEVERAVADLWSALEADPSLGEAFAELREVLVTQGDLEGLYQLFDLHYRGLSDPKERIELLSRMGELSQHRLDDPARAAWCHRQIIRLDPGQVRSYRILAEILGARGQEVEVAEMLEAVVEHTDRPILRIKTLLELAELYDEGLGEPERARQRYLDVLTIEEDHNKARGGLARLAEAAGRWEEAADNLERLSQAAGNRPRASKLFLRLANARQNVGGAESEEPVGRALRRAVEVKPDHVEAIRALTEFTQRTGRVRPIELIVRQVGERFGGDEPAPSEDRALRLVFELFERLGWRRRTEIVASLLRYLGYQTDRTEVVRQSVARPARPWGLLVPVPPEETAAVFPPQLRPEVIAVLRLMEPTLVKAFPSRAKLLGASRKTRVGRSAEHPGIALARLFGRPDTEVYHCLSALSRPVLEPGSSPSLLLPSDFDAASSHDGVIWSIAFALAPAAMGLAALARLPVSVWIAVMAELIRAVRPDFLRREQRIAMDDELSERLSNALTRKAIDAAREDLEGLATLDLDALEVQHRLLQVSLARLASLGCLDLHAVLTQVAVAGPGPTCARAMVPFLVGPEFAVLQEAAGVVPPEKA